ncbi:MAG: 16S rRNA (adenine(1518)-N(6)/adenine(1519)-N(6)) -dimethyltransferase RsmA [Anaerolineae bacterium]
MTNPRTLLEQYDIDPKKSLGQNFLQDPNTLEKIVASADLMPEDVVVEVGPGTGALTELLAQSARHVFAIELDERLRPVLEEQLAPYKNVYLVFDDILKVDVLQLVGTKPFVVVANVPYYITSAILKHFLERHRRPRHLVLTVQLDVAERLIAKPGDMSLLAVSVQFFGKPRIMSKINPTVFWPRPEVDSAILRIDTYEHPEVNVPSVELFFRVVRAGFSQKRKQLKNALGGGLAIKAALAGELLENAGIDATRRAETLSLEEWGALAHAYAAHLQQQP